MAFLGFDHLDVRVRSLPLAEPFYDRFLPALGLIRKTHSFVDENGDWSDAADGAPYNVSEYYESPEPGCPARFIGIIEDPKMVPIATRIAFRVASEAELEGWRERLGAIGATGVEGETSGPYPALFFEDPCGTKLELCARNVSKSA
jgi:catechol 2,3-dioxygenase-like lactoylglutathione lyase family enzyme